ncbi:MAG: murein L,D-transpeptidase catalytic domain family protein [Bacteroidota bacterium]
MNLILLLLTVSSAFSQQSEPQKKTVGVQGIYQIADEAYEILKSRHNITGRIVIVDFSRPSEEERLFVYDTSTDSMLFQALVAHGKNTGDRFAKHFSNTHNSNQSSLGFYRISEQYHGKYGLSYRLDGLEPKYNDNARDRAVVIHPAWYVSEAMIAKHGRLGRSFGCPALSKKDYKKFTELVKPGSLLFVYFPDEKYFQESAVIRQLEGLDHLFASLEL